MTQPSLLGRLIKLTRRREDFITECFAAVLEADQLAARQYWRLLTAPLGGASARDGAPTIRTQVPTPDRTCRLDLVASHGRLRIGVEHKLDAAQGRGQLPRYVLTPRAFATHVALIAADYQRIPEVVLGSARYIRPVGGHDHFLWADFYPLLKRSDQRGVAVASDLVGLFDDLGLHPAHKLIGDLGTRDRARRMKADQRLYKAWKPLLHSLERLWDVLSSLRHDRQSEIYVENGPSRNLRIAWLDPFSNPGALRVRLKTDRRSKRDLMIERLDGHRSAIPHGRHVTLRSERLPAQHFVWCVEARIPWRILLARRSRATMGRALRSFILQLMAVAAGDLK